MFPTRLKAGAVVLLASCTMASLTTLANERAQAGRDDVGPIAGAHRRGQWRPLGWPQGRAAAPRQRREATGGRGLRRRPEQGPHLHAGRQAGVCERLLDRPRRRTEGPRQRRERVVMPALGEHARAWMSPGLSRHLANRNPPCGSDWTPTACGPTSDPPMTLSGSRPVDNHRPGQRPAKGRHGSRTRTS